MGKISIKFSRSQREQSPLKISSLPMGFPQVAPVVPDMAVAAVARAAAADCMYKMVLQLP